MKNTRDKIIQIRVTDEERRRFHAVADARGEDLSVVIRAHLDRLSRRMSADQPQAGGAA